MASATGYHRNLATPGSLRPSSFAPPPFDGFAFIGHCIICIVFLKCQGGVTKNQQFVKVDCKTINFEFFISFQKLPHFQISLL